ncbi:hypothetical protein [Spirosoma pulveris]
MKTRITSLLLAVAASSFANPTTKPGASFQSSVYVSANQEIRVAVDKQNSHLVEVKLLDEGGHLVVNRLIAKKQNQFRGRLDMSELPDGHYHLVITDGSAVETRQLDLTTTAPRVAINRSVSLQ